MNGQNESLDILLNRLVDGELNDEEYRNLLNGLELQPDGWRRCALAFLEAQAWEREMISLRAEGASPSLPPVKPRERWSWNYMGVMALACAASFLLAFQFANRWSNPGVKSNQFAGPRVPATTVSKAPQPKFVSNDNRPRARDLDSQSQLGKYRLVVGSNSADEQSVEMPVFAADDPRADMLLDEYATIPRELIRALESRGNHVQRQRNWVPMQGDSAVPVYVPVDELQVTPVSSRNFQ